MRTVSVSTATVLRLLGSAPFAPAIAPFDYGEVDLVGEGGYEGLRYHGDITGGNDQLGPAGWIEPTG